MNATELDRLVKIAATLGQDLASICQADLIEIGLSIAGKIMLVRSQKKQLCDMCMSDWGYD